MKVEITSCIDCPFMISQHWSWKRCLHPERKHRDIPRKMDELMEYCPLKTESITIKIKK